MQTLVNTTRQICKSEQMQTQMQYRGMGRAHEYRFVGGQSSEFCETDEPAVEMHGTIEADMKE